MLKFKNKFTTVTALLIAGALSFTSCTPKPSETPQASPSESAQATETAAASEEAKTSENTEMKKIGIIQIVEHSALDDAREGFIEGLKENGFEEGKNIVVNYQNAQNDQSNLKTISQQLVEEGSDLILANATPSAQSIAGETKDIPIVITSVTDPVSAKLVESLAKPNTNVTGTSDLIPMDAQFALIQKILPNVKKVGVLYSSSEANGEVQAKLAEQEGLKLGYEMILSPISNANDLPQVAEALASEVDAIYVPADNTIASTYNIVYKATEARKIPSIAAWPGGVDDGALFANGVNYFNLGKQTGAMASRILKGEAKPQDMPIEYLANRDVYINQATVDKLGITIPEDILSKAIIVGNK